MTGGSSPRCRQGDVAVGVRDAARSLAALECLASVSRRRGGVAGAVHAPARPCARAPRPAHVASRVVGTIGGPGWTACEWVVMLMRRGSLLASLEGRSGRTARARPQGVGRRTLRDRQRPTAPIRARRPARRRRSRCQAGEARRARPPSTEPAATSSVARRRRRRRSPPPGPRLAICAYASIGRQGAAAEASSGGPRRRRCARRAPYRSPRPARARGAAETSANRRPWGECGRPCPQPAGARRDGLKPARRAPAARSGRRHVAAGCGLRAAVRGWAVRAPKK